MWKKGFSLSDIRNNRSFGVTVRIAVFISALLLSLLCGLFYNAWKYEVERIERTEGGWHSRIMGTFTSDDIETIRNFANIKDAAFNEKEQAAELYFYDKGAVFSDTPQIAKQLGAAQEKMVYHYELLAMYLIRDSSDTAPRLLFPLFLLIMLTASVSLIVIIHNSFAVSMNARVYQFGIFSSIGATPKQIRACLLQEAAALSAAPVVIGNLLGIAGSACLIKMTNVWLKSDIPGRHAAAFGYHPLVLAAALAVTAATIWISAWLPARRLSRLTPLEAIKNTGELQLKRKRNPRLLFLLFGMTGELAGNALKAQKKALRTASLSLIFSFLAFAAMQCFVSLSQISTEETYFERYQGVWDIMATVKNTDADDFEEAAAVREIDGIQSAIVYQKAFAKRIVSEEELSEEMKAFGGFGRASANDAARTEDGWLINVPIVILDDESFQTYCGQIGISPQLDGAVILNQIRDVTNPDFRHPVFVPYLRENGTVSILRQSGNEGETAEIPVLAYTQEVPVLREEYAKLDYYELVHFMPASLWKKIKGKTGGAEKESYICIKAREGVTLEELDALQEETARLLGGKYEIEQENRIREQENNHKQIQGMLAVFDGFCVLLAVIGVGNVFSNTLGFVRQRRREFARYLSVGMTPKELKKMFCIEALLIAVRPVLTGVPAVFLLVGVMLKASYMEAGRFMADAPYVPIFLFCMGILGSVVAAYGLAWRRVRALPLAEVLKDDTMI